MSKDAYNYAIFLLSKRDYSIHKIKLKLRSKQYEEEEILQAIDKLIQQNYLREEEYKRMRIKSLLIRGYSNSYIANKLEQEYLNSNDIEINTVRSEQEISTGNTISSLVQKKLRGKVIPQEFDAKMKLKNKILSFLASKGHSFEEANEAISLFIK